MVDSSDAVLACNVVEFFDKRHAVQLLAIKGYRNALFERYLDFHRLVWSVGRWLCPGVSVLRWCEPCVFQVFALDGLAPQITVDRVDPLIIADLTYVQAGLCRVKFFLVSRHTPFAGGGDDFERVAVGREGLDACVEPDLVVALTGATVGYRCRTNLPCSLNQLLCHERPSERS